MEKKQIASSRIAEQFRQNPHQLENEKIKIEGMTLILVKENSAKYIYQKLQRPCPPARASTP